MSELTKCNHCTLRDMKENAEKRAAAVILGEDDGWTTARYSDHDEPSAWFLELTDGCVC